MPFLAECPFCQNKVRAPDHAAGLSLPCPKCGNSYTLAASMDPPKTRFGFKSRSKKKASAPLAQLNPTPTPALLAPKPASAEQSDPPAPASQQLRPGIKITLVDDSADDEPEAKRLLNPWGALSFILGSFSLLFAQIELARFLAIPMVAAGLIAGLVGLFLAANTPKTRWILTLAGSCINLAGLVVLVFFPDLLSIPPLGADADRDEDFDSQTVIPFGKQHGTPREIGDSDWVDAGTSYFQHGKMRLRLTSASIKEVQDAKAAGKLSRKRLYIGIRLINVKGTRAVNYESWNTRRPGGKALEPTLRDNHGKVYELAELFPGEMVTGQIKNAKLAPSKIAHDMLVFDAPKEKIGYLRLTLPAAAFGGRGQLRLQIPAQLIDGLE